jgi:hypothetical protein
MSHFLQSRPPVHPKLLRPRKMRTFFFDHQGPGQDLPVFDPLMIKP